MTTENRQFINAMFIMARKDVVPFLLVSGVIIGGMVYMHKNKDKIAKECQTAQQGFDRKIAEIKNFVNPWASKEK